MRVAVKCLRLLMGFTLTKRGHQACTGNLGEAA